MSDHVIEIAFSARTEGHARSEWVRQELTIPCTRVWDLSECPTSELVGEINRRLYKLAE